MHKNTVYNIIIIIPTYSNGSLDYDFEIRYNKLMYSSNFYR